MLFLPDVAPPHLYNPGETANPHLPLLARPVRPVPQPFRRLLWPPLPSRKREVAALFEGRFTVMPVTPVFASRVVLVLGTAQVRGLLVAAPVPWLVVLTTIVWLEEGRV